MGDPQRGLDLCNKTLYKFCFKLMMIGNIILFSNQMQSSIAQLCGGVYRALISYLELEILQLKVICALLWFWKTLLVQKLQHVDIVCLLNTGVKQI